jgi:hypothetical protein
VKGIAEGSAVDDAKGIAEGIAEGKTAGAVCEPTSGFTWECRDRWEYYPGLCTFFCLSVQVCACGCVLSYNWVSALAPLVVVLTVVDRAYAYCSSRSDGKVDGTRTQSLLRKTVFGLSGGS